MKNENLSKEKQELKLLRKSLHSLVEEQIVSTEIAFYQFLWPVHKNNINSDTESTGKNYKRNCVKTYINNVYY